MVQMDEKQEPVFSTEKTVLYYVSCLKGLIMVETSVA